MKLSAYYKDRILFPEGNEVVLKFDLDGLETYDKVFVSKVFTDTEIKPSSFMDVMEADAVQHPDPWGTERKYVWGGTGFYFDKAPNLPDEIEHHMPDYSLYLGWVEGEVEKARIRYQSEGRLFNEGKFRVQFKEYVEYSIGFLTRGCFRRCPFCVNQKYDHVFRHSPLAEFHDSNDLSRKKVCLLDDNFFGFTRDLDENKNELSTESKAWQPLLAELKALGIPFKFKQGLDERILSEDMCRELFSSNYDGDYTFAFDNVKDYDLIHQKLEIMRKVPMATRASIRFYVLVGFPKRDETSGRELPLDVSDIEDAFRRIELLMKYRCLPYIMRYQSKDDHPWEHAPFRKIYVELARWCNQPNFFKKKSFTEYCHANQVYFAKQGRTGDCSTWEAHQTFLNAHPEFKAYFNLKFGTIEELIGEPDYASRQRRQRERAVGRLKGLRGPTHED